MCIDDLKVLIGDAKKLLEDRFNKSVCKEVHDLVQIFDLEKTISLLSNFKVSGLKIMASRSARTKWETYGAEEFEKFFKAVCDLPHVKSLFDSNQELNLLPHQHSVVFKRYRSALLKFVFESPERLFKSIDKKETLKYVGRQKLVNVTAVEEGSLDQIFVLSFEDGSFEKAMLSESLFVEALYNDEATYKRFGQEVCIAIDVALGASGCEAIVEGFYSVVGLHFKNGGQLNDNLVKRAIVDWCLPQPVACREAVKKIAALYLEGDEKAGLKHHRQVGFFDPRQRAQRDVSKVVDRLTHDQGRCPRVL